MGRGAAPLAEQAGIEAGQAGIQVEEVGPRVGEGFESYWDTQAGQAGTLEGLARVGGGAYP